MVVQRLYTVQAKVVRFFLMTRIIFELHLKQSVLQPEKKYPYVKMGYFLVI